MSDLRFSIMENMFYPIKLFRMGIYDLYMRDKAIKAFETYVLDNE